MRPLLGILIAVPLSLGMAQRSGTARQPPERVTPVSLCALQADPDAYNHKLVDVHAIVSHGFEDFTVSDPRCKRPLGIWLEYGGRVNSETIYCCGVKSGPRSTDLVVEGIATRLIDDARFRRFDAQTRTGGDVTFRARLIARFFAGLKQHMPNGAVWGGYGHLGCCSLLVIQQVLAVDAAATAPR